MIREKNKKTQEQRKKLNILSILLLMSLSSLISCGKSGSSSSEKSNPVFADNKTESADSVTGNIGTDSETVQLDTLTVKSTSSLPTKALSFKTNITLMNLSNSQSKKYNKAVAIVKKVVATEAFKKKVLAYKYAGRSQFADNKGKTNAQIYQTILDAAESLKPIKNNTMDLGVKMYSQQSSVVGYTNESITYINVNTKFFNTFGANEVAGNLFHEWLHKLGYDHDSTSTSRRPYSVPYAVGYMVRDIGKNFL